MKRAFALVSALVVLGLALAAGSAAAPGVTPNGFIGACNMVSAWPGVKIHGNGVGVQPGGGMERVMTVNINGNGNAGMNNAVLRTGGNC